MKILVVVKSLGVGGAETLAVDEIRALVAAGHTCVVYSIVSGNSPLSESLRRAGVSILWGGLPGRSYDLTEILRAAWRVRKVVRQLAPDLVHAHLQEAEIASRLALATIKRAPPLVVTCHGWTNFTTYPFVSRVQQDILYRIALRLYPATTCAVCSHLALQLKSRFPKVGSVEILYNGRDDNKYRPDRVARGVTRDAKGVGDDEVVLLCVANFHHYKNHPLLLRAVAALSGKWQLWLVGGGDTAALAGVADELGIKDRVRFLNGIADPSSLYRAADVFCLASRVEGMPMVLVEAMLSSLPVVATAVGGVPEVVTSQTGFLVESENEIEMSSAIHKLLIDSSLRRQLGEQGQKRALEYFTLRHHVAQLEALYRKVVVNA